MNRILTILLVLCLSGPALGIADQAVVRVTVPCKDGTTDHASGTLIRIDGQDGYVLTVAHILRDASGPVTVCIDKKMCTRAEVVGTDAVDDLAVLKIPPGHGGASLAEEDPAPGEEVIGYGHGGSNEPFGGFRGVVEKYVEFDGGHGSEVVIGKCSKPGCPKCSGSTRGKTAMECSFSVRWGDSGGPITNSRREVVGVIAACDGKTYGTCASRIRAFFRRLFPRLTARRSPPRPVVPPQTQPLPPTSVGTQPAVIDAPLPPPVNPLGDLVPVPKVDPVQPDTGSAPACGQLVAKLLEKIKGLQQQMADMQTPPVPEVLPVPEAPLPEVLPVPEISQPEVLPIPADESRLWEILKLLGLLGAGAAGGGVPVYAVMAYKGLKIARELKAAKQAQEPKQLPRAIEIQLPEEKRTTVVVDAPPAATRERIESHFVNVESDHYQRAHELARQQIARRYPGSQDILEAELNLTRQFAAGDA